MLAHDIMAVWAGDDISANVERLKKHVEQTWTIDEVIRFDYYCDLDCTVSEVSKGGCITNEWRLGDAESGKRMRRLMPNMAMIIENETIWGTLRNLFRNRFIPAYEKAIGAFAAVGDDTERFIGLTLGTLEQMAHERRNTNKKLDALNGKMDDALDEMAQWRKWIAQIQKPGKHRDAPRLAAAKQQAVVAAWNQYAADCRAKHKRPTWRGCLDNCGAAEIYTNALTNKCCQLIELAPDEAALKAIVHNAQAKQSARKNAEKSKSRQKRKRK